MQGTRPQHNSCIFPLQDREIALPGQRHYGTSVTLPCMVSLTQAFIEQATAAHLDTGC